MYIELFVGFVKIDFRIFFIVFDLVGIEEFVFLIIFKMMLILLVEGLYLSIIVYVIFKNSFCVFFCLK